MKLNIGQFYYKPLIIIAAALLLITVCLAGSSPSYADSSDTAAIHMLKPSFAERLDAHFSILHEKLKITPAQEKQWNIFTEVMLENTKRMQELNDKRLKNAQTMNALEDLKSYSEIADAHATGLKKFIPAFEALYSSMSQEQRKNADSLFFGQREMTANKIAAK